MKEFLTAKILNSMTNQKQSLILTNPNLRNFFTDIYLPFANINNSIPFLPIRCFRDFNINTEPETETDTIFYSSGSTNNNLAKHIFTKKRLTLYSKHSCDGFTNFLNLHKFKINVPIISLIPKKDIWQNSSLAAMIAMFKYNGFNIHYFDVENNIEKMQSFFSTDLLQDDVIVFGTTFHHLLVTEFVFKNKIEFLFSGKKLAIIDTGGTKGKTQSFTLNETIQIFKTAYGNPKEFLFLSEYGMCELGSQAWSINKIHDGTFICNETLTPIVINLRKTTALHEGEDGFLAFFDSINTTSWPTIITEDIGCIINQNEKIFQLKGRSPDASLKGCSLNVKESFFFLNISTPNMKQISQKNNEIKPKEFKSNKDIYEFINTLNPSLWTPHCWADLNYSLNSWNEIEVKNPDQLKNKNILIISSANIPITWLYPTRVAALLNAKTVHIKLPSLRIDDPITLKIRDKIEDLVEKMKPYFYPTEIILEKSRALSKEYENFDAIIVFGTDSTITTFQKLLSNKKTHIIPQGDVKNSLKINFHNSTDDIAKFCSLWLGRGCLTPICLFMPKKSHNETIEWIKNFQIILETNFSERYKEEGIISPFLHETQLLYTKAIIKNLGLELKETIFSGNLTHVINLTKLDANEILQSKLDFSFGGSGFVFVLDESTKTSFPELSCEKVVPDLQDKHFGKTWEEWFNF